MSHQIYNMTCILRQFQCAGYLFTQVTDYREKINNLFQKSQMQSSISSGMWRETVKQKPGEMTTTYLARWIGEGEEPEALIYQEDTKLIFDILLMWSAWGGEYACTGKRVVFETAMFFGDKFFFSREELINGIESAITYLKTRRTAKEIGLFPGLFLLLESHRTEVINYKSLYISPVLDLLSSKEKMKDRWNDDQKNKIVEFKEKIKNVLKDYEPATGEEGDVLWRNVFKPFDGRIASIGSPMAADKLMKFIERSPAMQNLKLSNVIIESHCRVFNQLRNATLHYAGLPSDLKLKFGSGKTSRIKKKADRDRMVLALTYFTFVFRDILELHFFRTLELGSRWGEQRFEKTISNFFYRGVYNDADWLESAFKDQVILIDD